MTIVTPICRAAALVLAAAAALPAPAAAQQPPIKLGDIQIYSFFPAGAEPYRKGWQMALDEINQKGGVMGRKLEVISRDDAGKPDEATRQAEELVSNEKVAMIFGGFLERRPGAGRFRAAHQDLLSRRRAADRCDHLAAGQQIHFPPASEHLHAGDDVGGRGRRQPAQALGDGRSQL